MRNHMFLRYWPPTSYSAAVNLTQRCDACRLHHLLENIAAFHGYLLQLFQGLLSNSRVASLEISHVVQLLLLFLGSRAAELDLFRDEAFGMGVHIRIDADNGQLARVLALLVEKRFVLDFTPLIL